MSVNKIVRISLAGGIIGSTFTNPRKALEEHIRKENLQGWRAVHFDHHRDNNALMSLLRLLTLIFTGGLWTWSPGYLVLFEREKPDSPLPMHDKYLQHSHVTAKPSPPHGSSDHLAALLEVDLSQPAKPAPHAHSSSGPSSAWPKRSS